jgi:hypothetical protein
MSALAGHREPDWTAVLAAPGPTLVETFPPRVSKSAAPGPATLSAHRRLPIGDRIMNPVAKGPNGRRDVHSRTTEPGVPLLVTELRTRLGERSVYGVVAAVKVRSVGRLEMGRSGVSTTTANPSHPARLDRVLRARHRRRRDHRGGRKRRLRAEGRSEPDRVAKPIVGFEQLDQSTEWHHVFHAAGHDNFGPANKDDDHPCRGGDHDHHIAAHDDSSADDDRASEHLHGVYEHFDTERRWRGDPHRLLQRPQRIGHRHRSLQDDRLLLRLLDRWLGVSIGGVLDRTPDRWLPGTRERGHLRTGELLDHLHAAVTLRFSAVVRSSDPSAVPSA